MLYLCNVSREMMSTHVRSGRKSVTEWYKNGSSPLPILRRIGHYAPLATAGIDIQSILEALLRPKGGE